MGGVSLTNQELVSLQASKLGTLYLEKNSFEDLEIKDPWDLADKFISIYDEIHGHLESSFIPLDEF